MPLNYITRQGDIFQVYIDSEYNPVLKRITDGEVILPYNTINGISLFNFDVNQCGIYRIYLNGIEQNQLNPIYVIPKEIKPINSINKYLFDYRYAVK